MTPSGDSKLLNVALIGSGRYAPAYVGILEKLSTPVHIKYIWSRTGDSARHLQQQSGFTADAEVAAGPEGYATLLQDPELAAVLLVLPPHVGPEFALRAVEAGKAALSEKPIATTAAAARAAIARYHALPAPPPWLVGENFRFQSVLGAAAAAVAGPLGRVRKMEHVCDVPFPKKTSYLSCGWRRDGEALPGGFMTDIGVHEMAALRVVAEAAGAGAPVRAAASASHDAAAGLTSPDTLVGHIDWESGLSTSISITLAAAFPRMSLAVSAANGTLEVSRNMWNGKGRSTQHELTFHTDDPGALESSMHDIDGMEREVAAFVGAAAAWRAGAAVGAELAAEVAKGAPEQALLDLQMIEALLESAQTGAAVAVASG